MHLWALNSIFVPIFILEGDQAADEEGVHPGVLQRQEVHVSVLFSLQVSQSSRGKQDVCQGERATQYPSLGSPATSAGGGTNVPNAMAAMLRNDLRSHSTVHDNLSSQAILC